MRFLWSGENAYLAFWLSSCSIENHFDANVIVQDFHGLEYNRPLLWLCRCFQVLISTEGDMEVFNPGVESVFLLS